MSVRAVLAVWSLALLAAGGGVALILASDRPWPAASVVLSAVIGLTFVGSGLLARVRRPERHWLKTDRPDDFQVLQKSG
jgi:hypothetical protein